MVIMGGLPKMLHVVDVNTSHCSRRTRTNLSTAFVLEHYPLFRNYR